MPDGTGFTLQLPPIGNPELATMAGMAAPAPMLSPTPFDTAEAPAIAINTGFSWLPVAGTIPGTGINILTATTLPSGTGLTVAAIVMDNTGLIVGSAVTMTGTLPITVGSTFTVSWATPGAAYTVTLTVGEVTPRPIAPPQTFNTLQVKATGTLRQSSVIGGPPLDPIGCFYTADYQQTAPNQIITTLYSITTTPPVEPPPPPPTGIPDTSLSLGVALQVPAAWSYDFDGDGISRAYYPGDVVIDGLMGGEFLPLTGGELSGRLTIDSINDSVLSIVGHVGWSVIAMNATQQNTAACYIESQRGGVPRWALAMGNPDAETGANTGTNITLARFNDDGSFINNVLVINRATGVATFGNAPVMLSADPITLPLQAPTKAYVDASSSAVTTANTALQERINALEARLTQLEGSVA